MTAPFFTQCPNCGTAFEVSERELSMADGIVRCGQCRHVFTATDFPVDPTMVGGPGSSQEDELPDFARHDDTDIEDISANLRFTVREAPQPVDEEPPEDAVFDDDVGIEEVKAQVAEQKQLKFSDDFSNLSDESGNPFANEKRDETAERPVMATPASPAPAAPAVDGDEDDEFADVRPVFLDDGGDGEDEEGDSSNGTQTGLAAIAGDHEDEDTPTRDDLPVVTAEHLEDAFSALDDDTLAAGPQEDVVMVAASSLTHEPMHSKLDRLAGAPIEMPIHDTRSWARLQWPWLVVTVIAVLGLLGQYTAYRFDRLAHDDRFRGPLSALCRIAGCTVPEPLNSRLLQASNLVVRSHPSLRNVLAVDFILTNDAVFDQPFPDLLLQFADVDGKPLAQRRLTPADYLAGEMAGAHRLPARQSVHVALEILDPGPLAMAYALQPLPATANE